MSAVFASLHFSSITSQFFMIMVVCCIFVAALSQRLFVLVVAPTPAL